MQGLLKFHRWLLKLLRKQNVTDGRKDGRTDGRTDNVKTVYPPTNTVCGGGGITKVGVIFIFDVFYYYEGIMVKSGNVVPCKYVSASSLSPKG